MSKKPSSIVYLSSYLLKVSYPGGLPTPRFEVYWLYSNRYLRAALFRELGCRMVLILGESFS